MSMHIPLIIVIVVPFGVKLVDIIYQGSTFVSNVTKKRYDVVGCASSMNCATENVVYLISCTRCGVQYVGETSQKLRSRFNNHRNTLKSMANLYLYSQFSSDGG